MRLQLRRFWSRLGAFAGAALAAWSARGAVLPEERADAMYHYYDGGGTKVDGPALLVRKGLGEQTSVYASYYMDVISGASIDVVTTASPYKETRREHGFGVDYLYRNTIVGLSYSASDERDYQASTLGVTVAHEIFDDLTTVSLGYTVGHDDVGKTDTQFKEPLDRYQYRLGLAQVFTKTFLVSLDYEGTLEDGFLNSPYRAARLQGLLVPEVYPRTRDSTAVAVRAVKGLLDEEGRIASSIRAGYRSFSDTWDIRADTFELSWQTRYRDRWILEPQYRYYRQSAASFYNDNFQTPMTYMARDKELATFKSHTLGIKASYEFPEGRLGFSRASVSVAYDFMRFSYDDFTDVRTGQLYRFDANVVQLFVSGWF